MLSVEKRPPATGSTASIVLKDLRHFMLEFHTPEECGDVVDSLETLSHSGRWRQNASYGNETQKCIN